MVRVPEATSFSGSASLCRRSSPGERGSVTSCLFGRLVRLLEQLHRVTGHYCRDRVLVDELGMPIPAQEHAEIIEPRHNALKLYAVHEKDRERNLVLADVIEES